MANTSLPPERLARRRARRQKLGGVRPDRPKNFRKPKARLKARLTAGRRNRLSRR